MNTIFLLPLLSLFLNFHSLTVVDTNANTVSLNSYINKKILIVNVSDNIKYQNQYTELEQLYQTYKDSLMIIAVPTNNFNTEPRTNDSIRNYLVNQYNIHFLLAAKSDVVGNNAIDIYQWFADTTKNGSFSIVINRDFQKILVGKNGKIIGFFNSSTTPLNTKIQEAITSSEE